MPASASLFSRLPAFASFAVATRAEGQKDRLAVRCELPLAEACDPHLILRLQKKAIYMEQMLSEITWWHWLVFALILFGVEMVTGTFDLLMASIAAGVTAIFASVAPESATAWHVQILVFMFVSIALIVVSRSVFPNMRKAAPEHPTLNKRMVQLVGQRGEITREFNGGQGQVRIGDTVWGTEAADGEGALILGDRVVVDSTRSSMVIVRKA